MDGLEQVEVVARVVGDPQEGAGVLRQAGAAPAGTGTEELPPDPRVVAHAEHHVVHVGAHGLAHRGDGVDEGELGGQEGVGGVLDDLGRRRIRHDQGRGDAEVEAGHADRRGLVVGTDHDPPGVEEVVDRGALPEELGVRDDEDVGPAQGPLDDPGRPDGHGRLVDDDRLRGQERADLGRHGLDEAEVRGAVRGLRCRHAQVHELDAGDGGGRSHDEAQAAVAEAVHDELLQALLDDRHVRLGEARHPLGVDVAAHHLVAEVGEAGRRGQTDVAGTDDGDPGHGPAPYRPAAAADRERRGPAGPRIRCRRVSGVDD